MESNGIDSKGGKTKKKHYKWKEHVGEYSSMDIDKQEYIDAAKSDPLWKDVMSIGEKDPMIWEVYKSNVTKLEKEKRSKDEEKAFSSFCNDRAYIVLCWHKAAITFIYDLHIWVSKHCAEEDYKLATIKAEQLNLFLDEKPILHREIQLQETDTFHDYFKVEVRRRKPEDRATKTDKKYDKCVLLQFHEEEAGLKGKRRMWMVERKFLRGNLCSDDVFVIMTEHYIYQWNGSQSNEAERKAAQAYIKQKEANSTLKFRRPVINETENDKDHNVYNLFPTTGKRTKGRTNAPAMHIKRLYKLTNRDGKLLNRAVEDRRTICKSILDTNNIYLLDTESELFVWIGNAVSYQERCRALFMAESFLMQEYTQDYDGKFNRPFNKPITLVNEENPYLFFDRALMR